jgi:hypothetical protein
MLFGTLLILLLCSVLSEDARHAWDYLFAAVIVCIGVALVVFSSAPPPPRISRGPFAAIRMRSDFVGSLARIIWAIGAYWVLFVYCAVNVVVRGNVFPGEWWFFLFLIFVLVRAIGHEIIARRGLQRSNPS